MQRQVIPLTTAVIVAFYCAYSYCTMLYYHDYQLHVHLVDVKSPTHQLAEMKSACRLVKLPTVKSSC